MMKEIQADDENISFEEFQQVHKQRMGVAMD
jgi:hypothetical protein